MNEQNHYGLNIDGPLFRRQRELLMRFAIAVRGKQTYKPKPGDEDLLEGLLSLTDAIADQAHDRHGIDCLLVDDDQSRCECEKPGFFCSGVPGILAHMDNRCDLCRKYPSDEAAFEKLRELDLACPKTM
jgi:hypothetical protein